MKVYKTKKMDGKLNRKIFDEKYEQLGKISRNEKKAVAMIFLVAACRGSFRRIWGFPDEYCCAVFLRKERAVCMYLLYAVSAVWVQRKPDYVRIRYDADEGLYQTGRLKDRDYVCGIYCCYVSVMEFVWIDVG